MRLKYFIPVILLIVSLHAQNITNTLGSGGTLKVQNSLTTDLMTVSEDGDAVVTGSLTVNNGSDPITLPTADGSYGQVISTLGNGTLTWLTPQSFSTTQVKFLICVSGIYPSGSMTETFIGQIIMFAGTSNNIPSNFMECSGQMLAIASYTSLYAVIGTTYGGDGMTNFALPNLSGSVPIGR